MPMIPSSIIIILDPIYSVQYEVNLQADLEVIYFFKKRSSLGILHNANLADLFSHFIIIGISVMNKY